MCKRILGATLRAALVACLLLGGGAAGAAAEENGCAGDGDCPAGSACIVADCIALTCLSIWQPVCGADGQTYSNRCAARAAHVEMVYEGECVRDCGGLVGALCEEGELCEIEAGLCLTPDAPGHCVAIPQWRDCPRLWAPECGCDGRTYANGCTRRAAGVSKRHDGECKERLEGEICKRQEDCSKSELCEFRAPSCGVGVTGVCVLRPQECPAHWRPVCGCDGRTYGNDCKRRAAGVPLLHPGECGRRCGPILGGLCPVGEVCDLAPGTCSLIGALGECVVPPQLCPDVHDPVCGCDGRTYGNDCERLRAGVALAHFGPCPLASGEAADEAGARGGEGRLRTSPSRAQACTRKVRDARCERDPDTGDYQCMSRDFSTCYEEYFVDANGNPVEYAGCADAQYWPTCPE